MINRSSIRAGGNNAAAFVCLLAVPILVAGCAQSNFTAHKLLASKAAREFRPALTDEEQLQTRTATDKPAQKPAASPPATVPTPTAELARARQLRLAGQRTAALKLLDRSAAQFPGNLDIAAQRGLLALETGRLDQAEKLLRTALSKGNRDWRLRSALGASLAARGRHKSAIKQLRAALRQSPNNPAILNNLALSYAMAGNLKGAERVLRRVVGKKIARGIQLARARQNLALVLGLRGKHAESRRVARSALPSATASANVSYLQRLSGKVRISRATDANPPSGRFAGLPQKH